VKPPVLEDGGLRSVQGAGRPLRRLWATKACPRTPIKLSAANLLDAAKRKPPPQSVTEEACSVDVEVFPIPHGYGGALTVH
jgi:hypothetical protein